MKNKIIKNKPQKYAVIAALSVPEHCLSFYFVCDDQIQISCAV